MFGGRVERGRRVGRGEAAVGWGLGREFMLSFSDYSFL